MSINPEDERRIRRNWSYLKQELRVEDFVHRLVDLGIFAPHMRNDILNVIPNTSSMRGEKFLNAVLASGNRGFQTFCSFLREDSDNRYTQVLEVLNITPVIRGVQSGITSDSRPSTALSSTSSGTVNSETGERNRKVRSFPSEDTQYASCGAPVALVNPRLATNKKQTEDQCKNITQPATITTPFTQTGTYVDTIRLSSTGEIGEPSAAEMNHIASQGDVAMTATGMRNAVNGGQNEGDSTVDMKALEQELIRIAPTIADLFKKINKQTRSIPNSEEELRKVKEENERLRKTNKSLIEKLNIFQQKIIQLQLDNKRLKENGDLGRVKKDELKQKAHDLREMEHRLDEHKRALEEKEQELNVQLMKLKEIEEENEMQKQKIDKLEELQDEGILERNIQQEQISTLVEEKEKQKDQIETLEENQKLGEQRLFRLEERLKMIEQGPRRQGRGRRVVSPPRIPPNSFWMNGPVERSHHANVKFQSEIHFNPDRDGKRVSQTKKGWPF